MPDDIRRRAGFINKRFARWFFSGIRGDVKDAPDHQDDWWKVMCLTGVDYFSTLGYQPGIAFLAAGLLSPIATAIVVLISVFGLVPLYSRVAKESPFGQGSIAMLEDLLPGWRGKTLILILLGFAATSWVITITLSAADATAHIVENPIVPRYPGDVMVLTCVLLLILAGVFLKGFKEAIGVSAFIVLFYILCNCVVLVTAIGDIVTHPAYFNNWHQNLFAIHHNVFAMVGLSMILFPKLALGMSGFETGVAVMPLVKGDPDENPLKPEGRIRNTGKLLLTAALIMAVGLMASSFVTTLVIPPEQFEAGGGANGRALAFLAHQYFGEALGTVYDISTIAILWFAGASAMAGLLNLVPRYLPRFGMAPEWAKAQRPLVLVFTAINLIVTFIFNASVDAQAGAYATGVLVLFTSAAFAVTLAVWHESRKRRFAFGAILVIFVYTTVVNMVERPEGLQIALAFILAILISSIASRSLRSLELRVKEVCLDDNAVKFIETSLGHNRCVHLLARSPGGTDYAEKEAETRSKHLLSKEEADFVFIEVTPQDPSEFSDEVLNVTGHIVDDFLVLRCESHAISNAIAATLLHLRDTRGIIPHVYFGWTEGDPVGYVFRYIFLGDGETAPITREILRRAEPDPEKRPRVIVG